MEGLYQQDLAYIHVLGFEGSARCAAPEIVRLLKTAAIQIHRVVDVGCGGGSLTKTLTEAGFEVTAIDSSAQLLEIACTAAPAAHFIHTSAYDVQLDACDAIIALNEPLTYHAEDVDADNLIGHFFQSVAEALPPGGLFIFDVIELGEPSLAGRSWASGDDWAVLVHTTEDQPSRTLVRSIETLRRVGSSYKRACEVHRVRLFDTRTLCDRLAACGFAIETALSYGAQPLLPRRRAFFATRRAP
jgi:SAM-dependent methyltransferase